MPSLARVLLLTSTLLLVSVGCGSYPTSQPSAATGSPSASSSVSDDPCHVGGVAYCTLNPQVTQATIAQTICKRGWTATVRPSPSYTEAIKRRQMAQGVNVRNGDHKLSDYELDHRLPLELGGTPSDESNLSLEFADDPLPGSPTHNRKDVGENQAKHGVCSGESLRQAQAEFVTRWLAAYPAYKA